MFKRRFYNNKEVGFGTKTIGKFERVVNKDGTYNVNRKGLPFFERISFFHWMINTKWSVFFAIVIGCFFLSSAVFALIYDFVLGAAHFNGIESKTSSGNYWELFFFSAQTSTTVGYGRINPATNIASFVAVLDALSGVLYFAIVTGLLYGRFSKPIPKVLFAQKGVFAPYKDGYAFMFRLANKLNHQLQNAEMRVIASLIVDIEGKPVRQFIELELELKEIIFLATSWTVVHAINEKSPFYNMTQDEFILAEPEFMLQLKVYDQSYSQDTFTNTSYRKEEIVWNGLFSNILLSENSVNYVDFTKFNEIIISKKN